MRQRIPLFARGRLVGLCVLAVVGMQGCFGGHGGAEQPHAEHIIPDHKPDNFPEAVEQIVVRTAQPVTGETAVQELRDITGWLPELAAQTDLPREDWNRIYQMSLRWEQREWTDAEENAQVYAGDLELLRKLAEKTKEIDTFNTYRTEEEKHV